jgi:tRNA(Phe) wybutosine-synthesizing methylase Tyw3
MFHVDVRDHKGMFIRAQAFEDAFEAAINIARQCGANESTINRLKEEHRRSITLRGKAQYQLMQNLRGR